MQALPRQDVIVECTPSTTGLRRAVICCWRRRRQRLKLRQCIFKLDLNIGIAANQ